MLTLSLVVFLVVSSDNGMCSSVNSSTLEASTSRNASSSSHMNSSTMPLSSSMYGLTTITAARSSSFTVTTAGRIPPSSSSSVSFSPSSTPKHRPNMRPPAELTEFGVVLVAFGVFLVAFMVVALLWICCKGRERSPQAPHVTVKMKPWRTPEPVVDDLATEVTMATDHPTSFNNSALSSSSANSPPVRHSRSPKSVVNFRESPLI